MDINTFETISALGAIILQIGAFIMILLLFSKRKYTQVISDKSFIFFFGITLLSIVGSLLYSEYYGIPACKLCWFQRILLFPQFIIIVIAWLHKEKRMLAKNILAFSLPGFVLALYQTLWQYRIASSVGIQCGFEDAVSCSQIHMLKFGFVTFPVVSASVFLFLIVLSVLVLLKKRKVMR